MIQYLNVITDNTDISLITDHITFSLFIFSFISLVKRVKCPICFKEFGGLVDRLRTHYENCISNKSRCDKPCNRNTIAINQLSNRTIVKPVSNKTVKVPATTNSVESTMDLQDDTTNLQKQLARYIFATNSNMNIVENTEFIKFCQMLRPNYRPCEASTVKNHLLDAIYCDGEPEQQNTIENKYVCLSIGGWSDLHRNPFVTATIVSDEGQAFFIGRYDMREVALVDTVVQQLTLDVVHAVERQYKCNVTSVVSDSWRSSRVLLREKQTVAARSMRATLLDISCSSFHVTQFAQDIFGFQKVLPVGFWQTFF